MTTLYVAGPAQHGTADSELEVFLRSRAALVYRQIANWCRNRNTRLYLPSDPEPGSYDNPVQFFREITSLISNSTHVLVVPFTLSASVGIEAGTAARMGKIVAVWHEEFSVRSRMLSAIASLEARQGESMENFLAKLMRLRRPILG